MAVQNRHNRLWQAVTLAAVLAACSAHPRVAQTQDVSVTPAIGAMAPAETPATVVVPPGFDSWLVQFRRDAETRGVSQATLDAAFAGVSPIPRVIELDQRQPEYTQTFWRYLDSAVSAKRVADGQAMLKTYAPLLQTIEQQYGIPPRFLVAFWGLESNYGKDSGSFPVIGALATLAFDGRRADMFRGELINALTILDRGHVTPDNMRGSWAGAMGQTQFMPSTFLHYGVDADHDGRIDIWRDVPDALTSAANYLKALGWDDARTWGREVALPHDFDVGLASIDGNASETVKSLPEWSALGVRLPDGRLLPQQAVPASLVLPAGKQGPAFLVYENYRAILKFNRSTFYAIAIGHLADRYAGGPELMTARHNEEPLRREDVLALQEGLRRLGYLTAEPDGVVGGSTRAAVRAFQRSQKLPPDGYASHDVVADVQRVSGGVAAP